MDSREAVCPSVQRDGGQGGQADVADGLSAGSAAGTNAGRNDGGAAVGGDAEGDRLTAIEKKLGELEIAVTRMALAMRELADELADRDEEPSVECL